MLEILYKLHFSSSGGGKLDWSKQPHPHSEIKSQKNYASFSMHRSVCKIHRGSICFGKNIKASFCSMEETNISRMKANFKFNSAFLNMLDFFFLPLISTGNL